MGSGAGRCGKGDTVNCAALAAKPLPLSAMPMAEFPHLVPVILSGGSGTRLWPLSREAHPKQFLPLLGERSLLQSTWLRVQGLNAQAPLLVSNESHRFKIGRAHV